MEGLHTRVVSDIPAEMSSAVKTCLPIFKPTLRNYLILNFLNKELLFLQRSCKKARRHSETQNSED